MSTIDVEQQLWKLLQGNYVLHDKFWPEFKELVEKSGVGKQIITQFLKRILTVQELNDTDSGLKWLEKLKNVDNLYSLHLDCGMNLRVLFSRGPNGKIFLHSFYEKGGKRNTSYAPRIEEAIRRREEMLGKRK